MSNKDTLPPSPDLLRQIVREARNQSFSSSDDASPSQYVLAGWQAAIAAQAPTAPAKRCEYCDGTGDVHTQTGKWHGACTACDANGPLPVQAEPPDSFDAVAKRIAAMSVEEFSAAIAAVSKHPIVRAFSTQQPAPAAQEPMTWDQFKASTLQTLSDDYTKRDFDRVPEAKREELMRGVRMVERFHGITGAAK